MATALSVRWASWQYTAFYISMDMITYTPEEEAEMFGLQEENFDSLWTHKTINENGKIVNLISSLEFALTGIFTAIKEERNMRKHAVTALVVILAGFVFQVSRIEWLFLLLSIFLVVAFEIINSAIENVVDLASHYHFSMPCQKCQGYGSWRGISGLSFRSLNRRIDFSTTDLGFIILNSKRKL